MLRILICEHPSQSIILTALRLSGSCADRPWRRLRGRSLFGSEMNQIRGKDQSIEYTNSLIQVVAGAPVADRLRADAGTTAVAREAGRAVRPEANPMTLKEVVTMESSWNPYAIRVVGRNLQAGSAVQKNCYQWAWPRCRWATINKPCTPPSTIGKSTFLCDHADSWRDQPTLRKLGHDLPHRLLDRVGHGFDVKFRA